MQYFFSTIDNYKKSVFWRKKIKTIFQLSGAQEEELESQALCPEVWACFLTLLWPHKGETMALQ